MTLLTLSATGRAAPSSAWERYADIAQWPRWAPQISRVETDAVRIAPGVAGRVVAVGGFSVGFVVDDVDEDAQRWTWTVRRFHVAVRLEHAVRSHHRGCATSLTMDGAAPLLLGYAPIAQLALRRLVRG